MVMHVNRAGPDNTETSLAAKLHFTFKFSPFRHTRISSRKDSHLAAFPFQASMCLRSPEPASAAMLFLKRSANSHVLVAPAMINLVLKFLSVVRETAVSQRSAKTRLQNEQLRYQCEFINPLDDTRDACWISLISLTMSACCLIRRVLLLGHGPNRRCDMSLNTVEQVGCVHTEQV